MVPVAAAEVGVLHRQEAAERVRPSREEHVNGRVTNRYGDTFIRGNNVLYISAAEPI